MGYFKKIVGEKVYLSPRETSDEEAKKFTEWMNDFEVTDYIANSGALFSFASEQEWVDASAKDFKNRSFDIVTLKDDKLIGTVSLAKIDAINRSAELGIYIGDGKYRSKGFGTEAVNLILEYGFRYLNLHSVQLDVIAANERAQKCYLKCGFKETGRDREKLFIDGKYYDSIAMDILENEFRGGFIRNKNL